MTPNIDRPVNLDLGTSGNTDFQTPSQGKFDAHPGNDQSRHSGAQQEQQLQEDAARLRELLKAESPSLSASLPASKLDQFGEHRVTEQNGTACEDAGPFKLFQGSEQPRPESAPKPQGVPEDDRLALPSHSSPKEEEPSGHAQDNSHGADASEVIRPFELFSSVTPLSPESSPTAVPSGLKDLDEGLSRLARTLLVSEDVQGSQTIRMELTADHYPGVMLEVFKDEGAIVAQFVCSNEHSRTSLARATRWLSESLSSHLNRTTLVRVLTDDPEDPSPVEARHHA